ncbi:ISL3 family transposase [Aceticella autotrophica]|uniref:ISL3 family transposase n=1 Tax=Aceticella autotrophica TaxID=2755338 RepID=A0A975AXS2_9THEO|nr:ISL3 family transposase [Aceticella autotrophica]QSZ28432.1 ISL3 family transposase [Aceticella autotrophica]
MDKDAVTAVCIDDFATKKRETYGTIMIDISTHKIVDMINSRDYVDVIEWLKTFPNIKTVSRDGSILYRNAIKDAHSDAIQVSDRFHILKNLTQYCKDYIMKTLNQKVSVPLPFIPMENADKTDTMENYTIINKKLTLKEKYEKINLLLIEGHKKSYICKKLNLDSRTFDKLINMTDKERENLFQTKMMKKHKETVARKQEKINKVREMFKNGYSKAAIAREIGIDKHTVNKYLDPNYSAVHASYGIKKPGKLSLFIDEINRYIEQGYTSANIDEIIRKKGYSGSISSIRHYISEWKHRYKKEYDKDKSNDNGDKISELIERKNLIKLLYKPIEEVKMITQEQLDRVCNEYPFYASIYHLVNEFREILLKKNISKLEEWIDKADSLKIHEIESFVKGLVKDIDAVRNAIIYDYNNGLAEGSVNKLKVIKRIMYGRCSFDTLKAKVLLSEHMRKIN